MKVYLRAPLKTSDSKYYKYLLEFPPKNVSYETNISNAGIITSKQRFLFNSILKRYVRKFLERINYPILNIHSIEKTTADLIHCAHCLPRTEKNWVADFEAPWQFWISGRDTKHGQESFLELVSKKNCKYLLAWTEEAREEMAKKFPSIKSKLRVVTYASPYVQFKKVNHKNITLLFSARYFHLKGGLHALEVIDRLTKKYENVNGIIISDIPKEIHDKYASNEKITFSPLLTQKELFGEIYPSADIFVYPGYSDTFGFGFIEAMNFGLPVVTVDGYARKEIIANNKTGFVISRNEKIDPFNIGVAEEHIISQLYEKTAMLIEKNSLRGKMSNHCIEQIKKGKFSINDRNTKLRKIYEEAIK